MQPKFTNDLAGIWRVCGASVTLRWLLHLMLNAGTVLRTRKLHVADNALHGATPTLNFNGHRALAAVPGLFGGVREIWVRDVYLNRGFLTIARGDVVVDLGANAGVFTLLAVAHGADVIAIECNNEHAEGFRCLMKANGAEASVQLHHVFVGGSHSVQASLLQNVPGHCAGTWWIARDLLRVLGGRRIGLLKCDIEGSEFELFSEDSALFEVVDQIAIELHANSGDPQELLARFERKGYEISQSRVFDGGIIAQARRK